MLLAALTVLSVAPVGLNVAGPQLRYGEKLVTLRGVCVGDIVLAREKRPLEDYQVLSRDWNANCVRIGVAPTTWKNSDRKEVMKTLKAEVAAALKNRMFVMIDWHALGWPDGYVQVPTWEGSPKDLYDSTYSLGLDFWLACAKEFKNDGRVAFHLWCEPIYQERDWETPMGSTWPKLKPWFEKLTNSIRKEGANNLVIATGNRWAYDLVGIRSSLLKDKNTAYMWHVYAGHDANDPTKWALALDDLHKKAPVIVSEWGYQAETTGHFKGTRETFGIPFLKFMEDRKLHWTAWCWHPTWGPPMLQDDWRKTTEFGEFVQTNLKKLNEKAVRP